mmetsp:Transcript_49890/g.125396  ORF Transcript_49890/g.125396 Transcript_49890/m.125396 type:complete len:121 (-) Transcript_49890:238-600(-)
MARLCPGEIVHLHEILAAPPASQHDKSVRVCGYLKEFKPAENLAVIGHKEHQLNIDIEDFDLPYRLDSLLQFIGELRSSPAGLILKPRVVRLVDGMDIDLYQSCVGMMRDFLEKYKAAQP